LFVGIFAILLENIVGILCVYTCFSLTAIVEFDVDWLDRDGNYGYNIVARIYRTIIWSLAMHGLTLSVALVSLRIQNFPWILLLVIIWFVAVTFDLVVPYLIFRTVRRSAQKRRIDEIEARRKACNIPDSDIIGCQPYRDEIKEVQSAKISPLRVKKFEV